MISIQSYLLRLFWSGIFIFTFNIFPDFKYWLYHNAIRTNILFYTMEETIG